jgi:CBS domain-containing protein
MTIQREPGHPLTLEYIPAATIEPLISIKASDTLERARTLMELHNFSQLPVLRGNRPTGIVSWESIGRAMVRNAQVELEDCIDANYSSFDLTEDLLKVIPTINQDGYVLVRTKDNTVSGIVTSADLGHALAEIAGPFLLLEQLEEHLRMIFRSLQAKNQVSSDDVRLFLPLGSKAPDRAAEAFTLGELIALLTHKAMWPRFTSAYDRATVQTALAGASELRNALMHFRSLSENNRASIAGLDGLVRILSSVSAGIHNHTRLEEVSAEH